MAAYYNENEPYAAKWLRNLIAAGHIAAGDVDERSIVDVRADDLRGYTQCHFFAGIGGWSYALRLAGWPDYRPVWTGSCPCQPFSNAGKQRGSDDERHLWPAWFRLISECRPVAVFGEQVAGAAGLAWLDHVLADLEGSGYAAAAADLPACSVGAPHIRQRLWWVANREEVGRGSRRHGEQDRAPLESCGSRDAGSVADDDEGRGISRAPHDDDRRHAQRNDADGRDAHGCMADAEAIGLQQGSADASRSAEGIGEEGAGRGPADAGGERLGDTYDARLEGRRDDAGEHASERAAWPSGPDGQWSNLEWLACSDGKARPTQPGLSPLAYGLRNRVGQLRAAGNAIVPQVAAEFVMAFMETER